MDYSTLKYSLLDPTHNYTILCESDVPEALHKDAAAYLMRREPLCEQVGFFRIGGAGIASLGQDHAPHAYLRMAGGEFCGNAAMSAAALYCSRCGMPSEGRVEVEVSGTAGSISVDIIQTGEQEYRGTVHMPAPDAVEEIVLETGGNSFRMALVRFPGISHLICTEKPDSERGPAAAIRSWCAQLAADGLGIMFLDETSMQLTPLVYIPGSDTLFWESSCASGTAALGAYLAGASEPVSLAVAEPGGALRVYAEKGSVDLSGRVAILDKRQIIVDL